MPARTPREAKESALIPVRRALLAITRTHVLGATNSPREGPGQRVLRAFPNGRVQLSGLDLSFFFEHVWALVESGIAPERWDVSSRRYRYHFIDSRGDEVLMYHWHPGSGVDYPHAHFDGRTVIHGRHHVPTGRISVEAVVRFAIEELGAEPQRSNWRGELAASESEFLAKRTWS